MAGALPESGGRTGAVLRVGGTGMLGTGGRAGSDRTGSDLVKSDLCPSAFGSGARYSGDRYSGALCSGALCSGAAGRAGSGARGASGMRGGSGLTSATGSGRGAAGGIGMAGGAGGAAGARITIGGARAGPGAIGGGAGRGEDGMNGNEGAPDGLLPGRRRARTRSATSVSTELEWVFFSSTPNSGSNSMTAREGTSNSRASSLMRIPVIATTALRLSTDHSSYPCSDSPLRQFASPVSPLLGQSRLRPTPPLLW